MQSERREQTKAALAMSYRAIDWAMRTDGLTSSEKAVLICLAWHLNDKTENCSPSIPAICARMGMGHNTVRAAIRSLEERALIVRTVSNGNAQSFHLLATYEQTTTQTGIPDQVSDPYPNRDTQIGSPTQIGSRPLPKQVADPYPNREENKEITRKEQLTVVGATVKKRSALTSLFKDSGLDPMPAKWREYCEQRRPDLNPDAVFADFRAWFVDGRGADERRGEKGWNSSWQGWVRRQKEQAYRNGYAQQSTDSASQAERILAAIKQRQMENSYEAD